MDQKYLDYFQLVCQVFFLYVFVGRTLYLRVHRKVRVFTLGVAKRGVQQAVGLSFLFVLAAWLVEIFLYTQPGGARLFPAPFTALLVDSAPLKLTGAALIVIGQIVFLLALLAFGDSWRVGVDRRSSGPLITGGVFAVIFLFFTVLVVAGLHYQILQEEKFLCLTYGQAYRDYCVQTGRYFGWRRDKAKNAHARRV